MTDYSPAERRRLVNDWMRGQLDESAPRIQVHRGMTNAEINAAIRGQDPDDGSAEPYPWKSLGHKED